MDIRDTYTNSIIKVHYILFYNAYKLYILRVKSFIHTKTTVAHHFEKVSLFTGITILLLLLKKIGSARLRESDVHSISPKSPTPQYQPIDRKKRKGKRVKEYSRDRAAYANKEALTLPLKPTSPTTSNMGLARSFQRGE